MLRERLGLDTNPNPTTKTEKDVCNLAARSGTSPVHLVIPASPQTPIKESKIISDREYTKREQYLIMKCVKLIQGIISSNKQSTDSNYMKKITGRYTKSSESNENVNKNDVSPADEGCADMTISCMSSNSVE